MLINEDQFLRDHLIIVPVSLQQWLQSLREALKSIYLAERANELTHRSCLPYFGQENENIRELNNEVM